MGFRGATYIFALLELIADSELHPILFMASTLNTMNEPCYNNKGATLRLAI